MAASSPGAFIALRFTLPAFFAACTCSAATDKSTVVRIIFRAATRTLSFELTWQSNTKAMLLVSSDASAKSLRLAPGVNAG